MKQSSYNHISALFPKQRRPRSTHWPHRHPSERSAHLRIRSQRAHFNWVLTVSTALRYSCAEIVSIHSVLSWVGLDMSRRNAAFQRFQIKLRSARTAVAEGIPPWAPLRLLIHRSAGWEVHSAKRTGFEMGWGALLTTTQLADVSKHTKAPGLAREVISAAAPLPLHPSLHSQKASVCSQLP